MMRGTDQSEMRPTRASFRRGAAIVVAVMATMPFDTTGAQATGPRSIVGSFGAGPLALAFDSAGGWRVTLNGTLGVEGAYELRGDTVRLRDRGGPRACSRDALGTYTGARTGRTMNLVAVGDSCQGRRGALARAWTATMSGGVQALVGLTLVDGTGAPARPSTTMLIENGRIRDVFPDGSVQDDRGVLAPGRPPTS